MVFKMEKEELNPLVINYKEENGVVLILDLM